VLRNAVPIALTATLMAFGLTAGCSSSSSHDGAPKRTDTKSLLDSGLAQLKQSHPDEALVLFRKAAAQAPHNAIAHYNIGVILQGRGQNADALGEYGLAIAADPKYVPPLFNQATIYGVTNPPLAIVTYRRVVELQPIAPTAYLNLGLLEVSSGLRAEGTKDLQTALKQDPSLLARLSPSVKSQLGKQAPAPTATPTP
jgi:Tfp pilus assembly protein PilF